LQEVNPARSDGVVVQLRMYEPYDMDYKKDNMIWSKYRWCDGIWQLSQIDL